MHFARGQQQLALTELELITLVLACLNAVTLRSGGTSRLECKNLWRFT